jgi:hypothetical protein
LALLIAITIGAFGMMAKLRTVRSRVPGGIGGRFEAYLGPDALSRTGLPDGVLR